MIKILLSNSFRSLKNQLPYSFINIFGLTIGAASVILLMVWILNEVRFDNFHQDQERIYRVGTVMKTPNREINSGDINAPAGPAYKDRFPVIEEMVRFIPMERSIGYQESFTDLDIYFTDPTFFDMFSFPLAVGDPRDCLGSPQNMVVTESSATKIFGSANPMGQTVLVEGIPFTISGVAKDPPANTAMQFECLVPLTPLLSRVHVGWDGGLTCYTFLKLAGGADPKALEKQILDYMEDAINKEYRPLGYQILPYLQPIRDIHLNSSTDYDLGEKGSKGMVLMFSGVGLLILLIACFNFINISTSLALKRTKEVCIQKTFGSDRKSVILFFLVESAIAILISLVLASLIVKGLLPIASQLAGRTLALSSVSTGGWLLIYFSLFVFCTALASFYSSFYLSSASPLALMTTVNQGKRRQFSRNLLVTFQYALSIALIICCLVIVKQMNYVNTSDKGFVDDNILLIQMNSNASANPELVKNQFAEIPGVVSVSICTGGIPGLGFTSNGYMPEGADKPVMANAAFVDDQYLSTLGISLLAGRDFRNSKADSCRAIINQTFANLVGWKDPVGKSISRNGIKYEVIGMVKDFNTSSFHTKTEPIFISNFNEWHRFENIVVKCQPANTTGILKQSERILKEIDPQSPFRHQFLEDSIATSYTRENNLIRLFLVLSVIAILISSLGLFGLATFASQSRMREISIRKINGAGAGNILLDLNTDLLKWIAVSFLVAAPIGYYAMQQWLNSFAYKTHITIWLLAGCGLFALVIGFLTVSWAAYKVLRSNPAEVLRKE